ncbi:MAG: DUF4760 domain-containing protein [Terriglobia bacterium]
MVQHLDHHDAELLLRLYDLRRETKLREARDWFAQEFQAASPEDFMKRYPFGTEENTFFRMVVGYWNMAASILNHGLINEELFFENNGEMYGVWSKIKPFAPAMREMWKNPMVWKNIETAGGKYEKWISQHAPEALGRQQEVMQAFATSAAKKKS